MKKQNKIKNLLRFNAIRLFKLLEIIQFTLLGYLVALYLGGYINRLFSKLDETKPTYKLVLETLEHLAVITVVVYYINKLLFVIPFFLAPIATKFNYIPSKKSEAITGITIGVGYVIYTTQTHLENKISHLIKRIHS